MRCGSVSICDERRLGESETSLETFVPKSWVPTSVFMISPLRARESLKECIIEVEIAGHILQVHLHQIDALVYEEHSENCDSGSERLSGGVIGARQTIGLALLWWVTFIYLYARQFHRQ